MSKKSKWKKFRPNSFETLENALAHERKLTSRWYERMSGQKPWGLGERESINQEMDLIGAQINALIIEDAITQFAASSL